MRKILLLILVATVALSCIGPKGDNGEKGDKGDSGARGKNGEVVNVKSKTGTIIGFVELFNNLNIKEADFSGVKIELKSGTTVFTSTTDKKGKYTLKDVTLGSYDVIFTKDGYPTYKIVGFNNIGGICYPSPVGAEHGTARIICTKTKTTINKDVKIDNANGNLGVEGTFGVTSTVKIEKRAIAFISKDKNVSPTNYEFTNESGEKKSDDYYISLYRATENYKSGDKFHIIVYGKSTNYADKYFNKNENIWVYPNLSESNSGVIPVTVP